jgi:hypothetical protein
MTAAAIPIHHMSWKTKQFKKAFNKKKQAFEAAVRPPAPLQSNC